MTREQALEYFNSALKRGDLYMGSNYLIDREDTVWDCTVWAGGGIWDVQPIRPEFSASYHEVRRFAAMKKGTMFENREEVAERGGEIS